LIFKKFIFLSSLNSENANSLGNDPLQFFYTGEDPICDDVRRIFLILKVYNFIEIRHLKHFEFPLTE